MLTYNWIIQRKLVVIQRSSLRVPKMVVFEESDATGVCLHKWGSIKSVTPTI